MILQKTCLAVTIAAILGSSLWHPAQAQDAGMGALFSAMGAYGNTTGPGAYSAGGVNVVTGGSLYMRMPPKSLTPVQVSLPSLKYGCGGIDLHMGSFSFASKTELVNMLKSIGGSAVAAFGFKIAMEAISPLINGVLKDVQGVAQALNATNINSCEAGQAIAAGMGGDIQTTKQYFARAAGPITSAYDDWSQSREKTQASESSTKSTLDAVPAGPEKNMIEPGNIAWRALTKLSTLTDDDRMILMAMSGTVIYTSNDPTVTPTVKAPLAVNIQTFIHGDPTASGTAINVYKCTNPAADQCLTLIPHQVTITPYKNRVLAQLTSIANKFKTNAALSTAEIQFINVTNLPVYKAMAVTTAKGNVGLDSVWINKYAELIAAEYAFYFISELSQQLRIAFAQSSMTAVKTATKDFKDLNNNVDKIMTSAREAIKVASLNVTSNQQIVNELAQWERNLLSNLPGNLAGNLRFAGAAK